MLCYFEIKSGFQLAGNWGYNGGWVRNGNVVGIDKRREAGANADDAAKDAHGDDENLPCYCLQR